MDLKKNMTVYWWDKKTKELNKGIIIKVSSYACGSFHSYTVQNCKDKTEYWTNNEYDFWTDINDAYKWIKKNLKEKIKIAEYDLADNTCALESLEKFYKENK